LLTNTMLLDSFVHKAIQPIAIRRKLLENKLVCFRFPYYYLVNEPVKKELGG